MATADNMGNVRPPEEAIARDGSGNSIDLSKSSLGELVEETEAQTQEQFDELQGLDDPVANITNEDRFFGARQPILRGTSASGTPIFVANQALTPLGILDKKEAAIDAARRKAAERKAKFKLDKAQRLKNANYQKSFDEAFIQNQNNYINEAKSIYGDRWTDALGSDATDVGKRYRQSLSNFQTLKDQADTFTDRAADIKARIESGDASVSEKTANMVREVEAAIGQFQEGKATDLVGKMDQLNASVNIDNWLNDNIFPNLKQVESKWLSGLISDGEYQTQISGHTKRIMDQAKATAARLKRPNGVFGFDPNITEQDIVDAIATRIGDYTVTGPKVVDKPKKTSKKYTDEDLSNRYYKTNTIKDPYKGGTLKEPTAEAKKLISGLVGSKYEGRLVNGARYEKGTENQDLIGTIKSLFSYYKDVDSPSSHKSTIVKKLKDLSADAPLVGETYNDGEVSGTVKSIDFEERDDVGYAKILVNTDTGIKTVEYPMTEDYVKDKSEGGQGGFSKMKNAFKVSYPDKNDRAVFTLAPASKGGRQEEAELDLTATGNMAVINNMLNQSPGESVNIPTPDLEMYESGIKSGATQVETPTTTETPEKNNQNTPKKEEKPVTSTKEYTQAEIEKLAKDKNTTVDKLVKWAKDNKGVTIVIK